VTNYLTNVGPRVVPVLKAFVPEPRGYMGYNGTEPDWGYQEYARMTTLMDQRKGKAK